jgi:hypothetical protein
MKKIFFILVAAVFAFAACKKVEDLGEAPRLFRPVVSGTLSADSNTIVAAWQKVSGAKSYTLQLSRDTFRTIDKSWSLDTNMVAIKGLLFNQLYQLQVRAIAPDTVKNSGWSNLGSVKTLTSILKVPAISDITFNSVRVTWTTKGAPVSSIKIIKTADSSVVSTTNLTATDLKNESKIINGLTGGTRYTIFLYSGSDVRGYVDFTTTAPFAGVVIDLTAITGRPSVLTDTLPTIANGTTILLKRGETYNVSSTAIISNSVTIMSGPDLSTTAQAKLYLTSNFSVADASTISYIDFKDVYLLGASYSTNYVFNTSSSGVSANIGRLSFEDCKAEIFRGIARTQSSNGVSIANFVVNRCIMDSLSGYGVITVDNAAGKVDNISITNSTIYKAEKLITSSKVGSTSVLVDNCTINEAPWGNNYLVDYGSFTVTNGITVSNCILGVGKNNSGNVTVRHFRALSGTAVNATNNFRTSDQLSTAANDLPNIVTYTKTAPQLWQDPSNGNFTIIDASFPGKSNAGDPRWRP